MQVGPRGGHTTCLMSPQTELFVCSLCSITAMKCKWTAAKGEVLVVRLAPKCSEI